MKVLFLCGFILLSGLAFAEKFEYFEDAPQPEPAKISEPEPEHKPEPEPEPVSEPEPEPEHKPEPEPEPVSKPEPEPEHVPEPEPEQCATVKHQKCSKPDKVCTSDDPHCTFTQVCSPFFVKKCCRVTSVERKCKFVNRCVPKYSYVKVCEHVKRCPPKKQCKNVCRQVDLGDHKVKSICEQECKVIEHPGPCKFVDECFSKWVSKKVCGSFKTCWDMENRKCRTVSSTH